MTDMLKKATLKEGFERGAADADQPESFIPGTKEEMLIRELSGIMLVAGSVWKSLAERADLSSLFAKDSLLNAMMEKGESAGYDFDKFLKILDKEDLSSAAGRLYFEKKYRLGLNNSLEEITMDDPLAEAENIIREIKKEERKEKLNRIIQDLKIAEKSSDREAARFLRSAAKKISGEIAE